MRAVHTAYDEVTYPGYAYPQTHPDRLSAIARLNGMTPAPADRCLVLELGCGDGSNLIPMAFGLPDSTFFGIDVASAPISKGRKQISQLRLTNISVERMDILDFPNGLGPFDYILAHGVYSWVSPTVQEKIFEIVDNCLSQQGVAYISYNTLPGGHLRLMVREMLLYHCARFDSPLEKIEQARSFMELLAQSQAHPNRYGSILQQEKENILTRNRQILFHDELAEHNCNVYFYQFMAQAANHHLQFLSEADPRDMQPANIEPSAVALLKDLGGNDILVGQQYLDFFLGRRFRQTLLCRASVVLDRVVTVARVANLMVAANAQLNSPFPEDALESEVTFREAGGEEDAAAITTSYPLLKAALISLSDTWPLPISFDALWDAAHNLLLAWNSPTPFDSINDRNCLVKMLFLCHQAGLVELHSWRPHLTPKPGRQPLASPLARLQSLEGDLVTTLCHDQVRLNQPVNRKLLQLLDGTRDRSMILHDLEHAVLHDQADGTSDPEQVGDPGRVAQVLKADLDRHLDCFARLGLLIS